MTVPPRLVLFDFDGVIASYSHAVRIAHLAGASGSTPARVKAVLFESGLETAYDAGALATDDYLRRLGDGIGWTVGPAAWIAARTAATRVVPAVVDIILALAPHVAVGVLTNNGALMADAVRGIAPALFPLLEGRVLCSGVLGARKPERAVFERALAHFGEAAADVLFVDDLFANVRGAWAAGLRADTVRDARALRRVLGRNGLGDARN